MPRGPSKKWGKKPPPAKPHPGEMPTQMDSMGHVMGTDEQAEKWKKAGLCPTCGRVKTHNIFLRGTIRSPIQEIPGQVYKGKCLKCKSLLQVKSELNEQCDLPDFGNRMSVDQSSAFPGREEVPYAELASQPAETLSRSNSGRQQEGLMRSRSGQGSGSGSRGEFAYEDGDGRPRRGDHPQGRGNEMGRPYDGYGEHERARSAIYREGDMPHGAHYEGRRPSGGHNEMGRPYNGYNERDRAQHGGYYEGERHGRHMGPGRPYDGPPGRPYDGYNERDRALGGSYHREREMPHGGYYGGHGPPNHGYGRGDHFNHYHQPTDEFGDHPPPIREFKALQRDDVSVISMDPSIMTTDSGSSNRSGDKNNERGESLEKIEEVEERGSNDVTSDTPSHDHDHGSSTGNLSRTSRTHTLGDGSANPSSRVGAVSVEGGGGKYENLLARKMAADTASRAPRVNPVGGNISPPAPQAAPPPAPPSEAGHVHFRDEGVAVGAQAVRKGFMEDKVREKQQLQMGHVRSMSDTHQESPPKGENGHRRCLTHGDSPSARDVSGEEDDVPKRSMSIEDAVSDGSPPVPPSKPGAQSVKDGGKYVSLYERKIFAEDALKKPGHSKITEITPNHKLKGGSMPESDARDLIAECASCRELMDALKRNSSSTQAVILLALGKLRDCLLVEHGQKGHDHNMSMDSLEGSGSGSSKIALPNGGWAKIMMLVMSCQSSNAIIQSELLHTLWSILTLHSRYTSDLISDMEQLATIMEAHTSEEPVQEYGCGIIACIAASQKHALRLMSLYNGKFIHRLMSALNFKGRHGNDRGNVQGNALKALFRLSSASLSRSDMVNEPFSNTMGLYVGEDTPDAQTGDATVNANLAVLYAMQRYQANESVQINGNRLLWHIFLPDAIMDPDYVDILVGKTLKHIGAMESHQCSQAYSETAVCLLSKVSCFACESLGREPFLHAVVETMKAYPNSGIVAMHGCRCFTNVCSRSQTAALSQPVVDGIPVVISCMEALQEHITVQAEACAALSAICRNSPVNKEKAHHLGALDRLSMAYDAYSMTPYEDHCVATKIKACVALTTLAVDPIVLSDIREKGIIMKFERLMEEDLKVPGKLRDVIQDLLNLAFDEENADQKLVFRDGASEEETFDCLRANLRLLAEPDFTMNRIAYLRSNALGAMKNFPESADVHEHGCKLLASLFDLASDDTDSDVILPESIVEEELGVITRSLAQHKNKPANAAAACSALRNFCVLLSLSSCADISGSPLLARSLAEQVNALIIYREDEQVLVQATGALWALCTLKEGLALSFESDSTVGLIVGAMGRFPDSADLQRNIVGLLGLFFSVSDKTMEFANDELVTAIMKFIEDEVHLDHVDAEDFIDTAVNIILILTHKGFQAVTLLLRNETLIDTIVLCMYKFPASLSIQGAGVDILTNIALDNYLRADVCQRGGTKRIISALDKLKDDPLLVSKAFAALANLISGADVEILRDPDAPAPGILVRAMTAHPEDLTIQIGAAYSLWALSARSDSFKDEIVNLGGAEAIADAMARFLGSKQMQAKGFVVIWSLAVPRHLKMRVGRCAIDPVVDGLSAHIASEKACEEALGCLKCLSTIPANKELLEDAGAVDLIYSCMWLHSENSTVCKAALAALCNISVNIDTNEVSEITGDDLDAVVNAMRSHQNVKVVQESAIILLRNFTFSRTNCMVLERNDYIVPLVHSAMSIHNDHFQGRADDLLRVLPCLAEGDALSGQDVKYGRDLDVDGINTSESLSLTSGPKTKKKVNEGKASIANPEADVHAAEDARLLDELEFRPVGLGELRTESFGGLDLSAGGQVLSADMISADRLRKGLCDTCRIDPVRCYEIKKRIGGFIRERVPLTEPGKVYNGICLDCHPDQDPDGGREHAHRRARRAREEEDRHHRGRRHHRHHGERHRRDEHEDEEGRDRDHNQRNEDPPEYVEEITYNIFGEPIIKRKPKSRRSKRNVNQDDFPPYAARHTPPSVGALPGEEELPSVLGFAPVNESAESAPEDDGSLDFLAQLVKQRIAENPEQVPRFEPGRGVIASGGGMMELEPMQDEISVMTPDTYWQGRNSVATMGTRQKSRMTNLTAISETSSGASSGQQGKSITSHVLKEPILPGDASAGGEDKAPGQDVESYLVSSAPHLLTLREIVGQCTQIGADGEAIDVVTQALIHDNATSMILDLALFCLTTLWVLARKSDENKRKIIFEDATFDAVIEAMQIYREKSVEIQTRACGLLWSLSMDPNDRKHVAQGGGCEAILNAMLVHHEEDTLQVMALGALKVLSFDNIGKSTLRSRNAPSTVADIMQKHVQNHTIQSEGCVILGNLAVDEAKDFVAPVTKNEIEAVVMGILAHPESLEVHEAACFTLMSLAASSKNVELIRQNEMSKVSLELAFNKHPDDVGINILTLLGRLKLDPPVPGQSAIEPGIAMETHAKMEAIPDITSNDAPSKPVAQSANEGKTHPALYSISAVSGAGSFSSNDDVPGACIVEEQQVEGGSSSASPPAKTNQNDSHDEDTEMLLEMDDQVPELRKLGGSKDENEGTALVRSLERSTLRELIGKKAEEEDLHTAFADGKDAIEAVTVDGVDALDLLDVPLSLWLSPSDPTDISKVAFRLRGKDT